MAFSPLIAFAGLLVVAAVTLWVVAARRGARVRQMEEAVATLARSWSDDGSSRGHVLEAARHVARASLAFLAEPSRRGDALVVTATADATDLTGVNIPMDGDSSGVARVFLSGVPIQVGDVRRSDETSARLLHATRVRSLHLRPIHRQGRVVGVLALAWRERREALRPAEQELVGVLGEEMARAVERDAHVSLLARQARTDELTALPNRRAWEEAVTTEMARAQRTGQPLCLALLDLDHFKAYNDAYGHPMGDAHLRRTATEWRRELRAIDVLARYGGEEFGVLLPNTSLDKAHEVIDRVRAATPNDQTASAGVVVYDGRESRESLLARADSALYRAKHAGRATTVPA